MTLPPRIAVGEAQIEAVVTRFYARVRAHSVLGPVFAAHITDWPTHEEKIGRFWRNALLLQQVYDGNPMQVHAQAGNVRTAHFPVWLALFDQVLTAELPPLLARGWSARAHRIGRGLSYGLPQQQADDVPRFGGV